MFLDGGGRFRITSNGELYTTGRLVQGSEYLVTVQASDTNAANAQSSTQSATADIRILADRRPPQFYQSIYETSIAENIASAQYVFTLTQ